MSRIAYVNGRYVPHRQASVHVEDRGYQFADGVYEVVPVVDDLLVDEEPHLDRLDRSLRELRIAWPIRRAALKIAMREVLRRNYFQHGIIYIQMTRGVARRDHPFPKLAQPAVVITAARRPRPGAAMMEDGVKVISVPDIRWGRCDIKTVSLLPNVLAKQQAREAGAYEAWLVDEDGNVTEGGSSNAWIVTREGELVTRPSGHEILSGITRRSVLQLVREEGLDFVERPFSLEEAKRAREAFVTSATSYVTPVVEIDEAVVGNGKPGSIAQKLYAAYRGYMTGAGATR
ncbi:MAG: D-amino-acid transaminase [Alphaproteobacteria bacterium]|nr:D-amino-acid transaminase [Alphaproteobacteria bacterium]